MTLHHATRPHRRLATIWNEVAAYAAKIATRLAITTEITMSRPPSLQRLLRAIRSCLRQVRAIDRELPRTIAAAESILAVLVTTTWRWARFTKVSVRLGVRRYGNWITSTPKPVDLMGHALVLAGVLWLYWLGFACVGLEYARRVAFEPVTIAWMAKGLAILIFLMLVFCHAQVVQRKVLVHLRKMTWWKPAYNYLLLCPY